MLQRLPPLNVAQLSRMTVKSCQDIIGKRSDDPWPQFEFVEILVGSLPLVTIGFVFKNGVKVGELPRSRQIITLMPGQFDSDEFRVGDKVEPPQGWPEKLPHRTLNLGEYSGLIDHPSRNVFFSNARLWVHTRNKGKDKETFIVPRSVILKAFYAQHSEIAKATIGGPWEKTLEDIICLNDIDSQLKTEIVDEGRQWNIILRTLVQDDYASILAVLMFDPFGRACAESLYTKSLQDRDGDARAPWFASAQIPLQALKDRLLLETRCITLKSRYFSDGDDERCEHRKYLVTEISGGSWPTHYPVIGYSRTNSADDAPNPVRVEHEKPYSRAFQSKDGNPETTLTQAEDAKANSGMTTLKSGEWNWLLMPPVTTKLEKKHSKKYPGQQQVGKDEDGTRVSTGEHTHEADTIPKAEATTPVRVSNARFERVVEVLNKLAKDNVISAITEVAPANPKQISDRSGHRCWKFLDPAALKGDDKKRPGWRLIYRASRNLSKADYRSALILQLTIGSSQHYWIEIECRPAEMGFYSVLLSGSSAGTHSTLTTTLDIIAEAKGARLKEHINSAFSHEQIQVATYKHIYNTERTGLTEESVRKFLTEATLSPNAEA